MCIVPHSVAVCEQEWLLFGRQEIDRDGATIRRGMQEADERFRQRLRDDRRAGSKRKLTRRDADFPCSAAFVSWALRQAGGERPFPASAGHSRSIRRAIGDRRREIEDAPLRDFRTVERAPAVGDPIGYAPAFGVDFEPWPTAYASSADIVAATGPGGIVTIGGDVGNSVSERHRRADGVGRRTDRGLARVAVPENRL